MSILKICNLSYEYRHKTVVTHALNNVNAEFQSGKLYALTGRSGSGKTTLISLIAAFDKPKNGDILFDEQSIFKIDSAKYRRENIGMVFQSYNLIQHLTALENVLISYDRNKKVSKSKKKSAKELMLQVGLDERLFNKLPQNMSGGEQQRVAIARALASNVPVILADEPTGNLDNDNSANIILLLKELAHKNNKCVIVVTHSSEIANEADIRYHLSDGTIALCETK